MEHLLVNGNLPKTRKVNNNRGNIPTIVKDFYSNKKDLFLQDLSKYIGNFCLTKDDIQLFLNYSKTKSKRKTIIECIQQCYREAFPVSPEQTLFISETFTGEKLRNELRKLLPGILPSDSCERVAKRELKESLMHAAFRRDLLLDGILHQKDFSRCYLSDIHSWRITYIYDWLGMDVNMVVAIVHFWHSLY